MTIHLSKNEAFSLGAVKRISELCQSLMTESLVHFSHDITFGEGQITMLMNDANALRFYFQHRIPAICVDETGRTFDDGIYLGKVVMEYYHDASVIIPKLPLPQNSIHICKREPDYQHLYSFHFDLNEYDFLHWVLNHGNLLSDFIDDYNTKANDILLEAYEPDSRTVLPLFSTSYQFHETSKPFQIRIFHKDTHQPIVLATQQSNCLILLSKGKSAKEIASHMQLSRRTVEHYFDKIRKILGCSSNRELIAFYGEQLYKIRFNSKFI